MPIQLKLSEHGGAREMLENMPANAQRGIERAFWRIGRDLKSEVDRQVLRTPKTGKVYKVGRRFHRSSAEGQSHANLSGQLRKSTGFTIGGGEMKFGYGGGRIRAPKYAAAIELGRRDKTIAARPTLQHSIDNELGNAVEHLGHYVAEVLDES